MIDFDALDCAQRHARNERFVGVLHDGKCAGAETICKTLRERTEKLNQSLAALRATFQQSTVTRSYWKLWDAAHVRAGDDNKRLAEASASRTDESERGA
jgi:hypothetical protein